MMTRALILGGVLVLVSACATTTYYRNALHPEYRQTDFDRDWYECRRENTRPKVSSVVVPNLGTYDAGMVVDEDLACSCLAARGWRPATSSQASPPPAPRPPGAADSTVRPDEIARTERVQKWAREMLAKPYVGAPFACTDEGWMAVKNYVVDVA